eukprot:7096549-Prymnesium_polylepis.1
MLFQPGRAPARAKKLFAAVTSVTIVSYILHYRLLNNDQKRTTKHHAHVATPHNRGRTSAVTQHTVLERYANPVFTLGHVDTKPPETA